jgi:hypothetical protein
LPLLLRQARRSAGALSRRAARLREKKSRSAPVAGETLQFADPSQCRRTLVEVLPMTMLAFHRPSRSPHPAAIPLTADARHRAEPLARQHQTASAIDRDPCERFQAPAPTSHVGTRRHTLHRRNLNSRPNRRPGSSFLISSPYGVSVSECTTLT